MKLTDLIDIEQIVLHLTSTTKNEIITELVDVMQACGKLYD